MCVCMYISLLVVFYPNNILCYFFWYNLFLFVALLTAKWVCTVVRFGVDQLRLLH